MSIARTRNETSWRLRFSRRLTFVLVAGALSCGCSHQWPFIQRQQLGPSLPVDATVTDVVDRLNENIVKLHGWRSTDVQISGRGLLVRLEAMVDVERERKFRMVARSFTNEEADLGSNEEWCWFWMKRSVPKRIYLARHEDVAGTAFGGQIPFQPDWLMQVLGVTPLNPSEYTLHNHPENKRVVTLVAETVSPGGRVVRRLIDVDSRHGLITGYTLQDISGRLLARARLSEHRVDRETGIVMPHRVQLEWPPAQLDLMLHIGRIDVNPVRGGEQTWQMPRKPGYEPFNIAGRPNHYMPAGGPGAARTEAIPQFAPQSGFEQSAEALAPPGRSLRQPESRNPWLP